jgi:hypothetical protein
MTTVAARWIGLLLAAAILPSCWHDHDDWVRVTVHNQGVVSADVRAETESWWNSSTLDEAAFRVEPQESIQFWFRFENLGRLKVRIYRSTDHFKVFDDFWDRDDLQDLDLRVVISVSP